MDSRILLGLITDDEEAVIRYKDARYKYIASLLDDNDNSVSQVIDYIHDIYFHIIGFRTLNLSSLLIEDISLDEALSYSTSSILFDNIYSLRAYGFDYINAFGYGRGMEFNYNNNNLLPIIYNGEVISNSLYRAIINVYLTVIHFYRVYVDINLDTYEINIVSDNDILFNKIELSDDRQYVNEIAYYKYSKTDNFSSLIQNESKHIFNILGVHIITLSYTKSISEFNLIVPNGVESVWVVYDKLADKNKCFTLVLPPSIKHFNIFHHFSLDSIKEEQLNAVYLHKSLGLENITNLFDYSQYTEEFICTFKNKLKSLLDLGYVDIEFLNMRLELY